MKIAIDKDSLFLVDKLKGQDITYIFEELNELLEVECNAMRYDYACSKFFDVNISNYEIESTKTIRPNEAKKMSIEELIKLPPIKENKIAIIVPNCNYSEWLEKSLGSIIEQTYNNYEVIFVDDASSDDSVEIARNILQDKTKKINYRIIPLRQKRYNGGTRNEAYLHISDDVDYIMYLDSDDWFAHKDVLKHINDNLRSQPDVLFTNVLKYTSEREQTELRCGYTDRYSAMKGYTGSCMKVIKKELATRQECLYNEGTLMEDKNHHIKICYYMKTFKCMDEITHIWNRNNNKSVTRIRDKAIWGTSCYRNLADAEQFYLSVCGQDKEADKFMKRRIEIIRENIAIHKDVQY